MENPYKRKKEPGLNKQLILDVATEIGAEDWSRVTFQAIAEKAGISKGGIIHHFKNKEELLDELVKQSLSDLTAWVQQYKLDNQSDDGALAYLSAILTNESNKKYRDTMRIIIQATMTNESYRLSWDDWYKKNIMPADGNLSVESMIVLFLAEGIWYSENIGFSQVNQKDKLKMLHYVRTKMLT